MAKHQYEIIIEASTVTEATAKMEAIAVLVSRLSEKELTRLAYIIRHDPVKTALAKKYLGV